MSNEEIKLGLTMQSLNDGNDIACDALQLINRMQDQIADLNYCLARCSEALQMPPPYTTDKLRKHLYVRRHQKFNTVSELKVVNNDMFTLKSRLTNIFIVIKNSNKKSHQKAAGALKEIIDGN